MTKRSLFPKFGKGDFMVKEQQHKQKVNGENIYSM